MKRVAITNWPPFPVGYPSSVTGPGELLLLSCAGEQERVWFWTNLYRALVNRRGAGYVVVEGRTGRDKVVLYFLVALGSGPGGDPGRMNSLFLHQVILRVDSPLRGQ